MAEPELISLHRRLVAIRSVSGEEEEIAGFCASWLADRGAEVERIERNVVARTARGRGPRLMLNSHLDTVPADDRWLRDPWDPEREGGKIHGLGSNDAKASVAAMMHALASLADVGLGGELMLALVCDEETGGRGTEIVLPALEATGRRPDAAIVGEPTGLDVAVSQKGLLIVELTRDGDPCHSANARALGARNPIHGLADDIVAARGCDLGPAHPELGATTMEATVIRAGHAKNRVPAEARCTLDLRTVPGQSHDELIARLEAAVEGEVCVVSKRLEPRACRPDEPVVLAASAASPSGRLFGSATMSDLVYFGDIPAVKCGPGQSERSHTPDEYVLESEIQAGAAFYRTAALEYFARARKEKGAERDT